MGVRQESRATTEVLIDLTQCWDVVIIGTGIGGATVGGALARQGFSVLFLEKGGSIKAHTDLAAAGIGNGNAAQRMAAGWWPQPVSRRRLDGTCDRFYAAIGCASGGSSIHYAAALGRMKRSDFDGLRTRTERLPTWPVSFDEFLPFYDAAESIYGVGAESRQAGESRFSEWDRSLMDAMRANGLKPEVLHMAIRYDEQCEECIGRVCSRGCKSDSRVACLNDALREPRCHIVEHCDVQSLDADGNVVRTVRANHAGGSIEIRARIVVLSAGAMHSPQILLKSRNSFWPQGLANRSDKVGRNLMFHTADIYALWAPRRFDRRGRQKKAMEIRDFHVYQGRRLGAVQSMGLDAGRGLIAVHIKHLLRQWGIRNEFLLSLMAKLPSHMTAWMLGEASVFAATTEDDPDPDNRIVLDANEPNGASFNYTINDDLRHRADALRLLFAKHVKPWRLVRLSPTLTMNYGHPCGTCRFGDDPQLNVLDRDCKAHDVDNLYVVDASFMPRSGAINPSLTIAANALRVAPRIAKALAFLRPSS